jgi:spore maturation protein CgeB
MSGSDFTAAPVGWARKPQDDTQRQAGPRVLVVHPGASWSTADVYNGIRFGLEAHGVQTFGYNLDVRIARSAQWLHWNWKRSGKQGDRPTPRDCQYHAASGLLERAFRMEPDWILVVSGMYLEIDIVKFLKKAGFKLAVVLTESPYDDAAQAEYIKLFDVVWTNERTSVKKLQPFNANTLYLAHAWHPAIHGDRPILSGDLPSHDVLFIGTGFPERIKLLREAEIEDVLALYGHWPRVGSRSKLRPCIKGDVVDNKDAAMLYRCAKINLSMHRTSKGYVVDGNPMIDEAESLGPRVYELAATGSFFISDSTRAELFDIFGNLVPTFDTSWELSAVVRAWLSQPDGVRRKIAGEIQDAVKDHHWVNRARQILDGLILSRPPKTIYDDRMEFSSRLA